ncbi:hypothetical protein KNO81_39655 [Paraburkholderia sediminicola]|nr:hypothetical protein [Paraburkholderia sediminicola]
MSERTGAVCVERVSRVEILAAGLALIAVAAQSAFHGVRLVAKQCESARSVLLGASIRATAQHFQIGITTVKRICAGSD